LKKNTKWQCRDCLSAEEHDESPEKDHGLLQVLQALFHVLMLRSRDCKIKKAALLHCSTVLVRMLNDLKDAAEKYRWDAELDTCAP
jgi:hypothetical protein